MKQKITQKAIDEFLKAGWTQAEFAKKLGVDASTVSRALKKNKCEGKKMNEEQGKIVLGAVEVKERALREKKSDLELQENQTKGLVEQIDTLEEELISLKQKETEPEPRDIYEPVEEMLGDHIIARFTRKQLENTLKSIDSAGFCKIGIAMRKI